MPACPLSKSSLGPLRAEVGLALTLYCRMFQALLSPLLWSVLGPSSVRFFSCPFRVCPLWARCVGVGVSLFFSCLFCVPRLVSRLSNLSSHSSSTFPFHLHIHLICRSLKSPAAAGRECVKHLNRCKTCTLTFLSCKEGSGGHSWSHHSTKTLDTPSLL